MNSWPWYQGTDETRFLKKTFWQQPKFESNWPKSGPKLGFFYHFLKFGSLVFLQLAYNDRLQEFITFSRVKPTKKVLGDLIWAKTGQNLVQNQVFCHFLKFSLLVLLEIAYNDSFQQCLTSSRGKIHEEKLGPQIWTKGAKIGSKTRVFAIFLTVVH